MGLQCSSCQCENVQKLSLVYENGISDLKGTQTSTGVGLSQGGLGVGVARSKIRGTQQTALSKKATPPTKKSIFKRGALYFVGIFIVPMVLLAILQQSHNTVLGIVVVITYIAVAVWHLITRFKYNKTQFPQLFQNWDKSYMCHTCGSMFIPSQAQN